MSSNLQIKKASKKELEVMMARVKRFDSAEFITVLQSFTIRDYIVYGANGQASVSAAIRAIKAIKPGRHYVTAAISKTERIVARV